MKKRKNFAYQRYLNALSVSVRGTGAIYLKRNPKDVLTNNFNRQLMTVHKANHDIQIVIDQVRNCSLNKNTNIFNFSMQLHNMLLVI